MRRTTGGVSGGGVAAAAEKLSTNQETHEVRKPAKRGAFKVEDIFNKDFVGDINPDVIDTLGNKPDEAIPVAQEDIIKEVTIPPLPKRRAKPAAQETQPAAATKIPEKPTEQEGIAPDVEQALKNKIIERYKAIKKQVDNRKKLASSDRMMWEGLQGYVEHRTVAPTLKKKDRYPAPGTEQLIVDVDKLLADVGVMNAGTLEELNTELIRLADELAEQQRRLQEHEERQGAIHEGFALIEKQGKLNLIRELAKPESTTTPSERADFIEQLRSKNEEEARVRLATERKSEVERDERQRKPVIAAIRRELALFLDEITDKSRVVREGKTRTYQQVGTPEKPTKAGLFARLLEKLGKKRIPTGGERDIVTTYEPPPSLEQILKTTGLSELDSSLQRTWDDIVLAIQDRYDAVNDEITVGKFRADAEDIKTLEDVRTTDYTELRNAMITREALARSTQIITGRDDLSKVKFARRISNRPTQLFARSQAFKAVRKSIVERLSKANIKKITA